jgi:2-keto-3-deoxy-L-fuconate dehydrogenase
MFSLQDKVAIVTGAASGIGGAIAESFVRVGALVYVADCNEAGGAAMVGRIGQQGGRARLAVVDVANEAECQALVQRVLAENGNRCDVLVNNAGVGHVGTILTTEPADLERLWQVNVKGAYFLSRAVLPAMIQRGAGSIINLASVAGVMGMEGRFAYAVTKHAVVGMTRSMAMDHGPTGVRINCICPGRTQTPFVEARLKEYPDPAEYLKQMVAPHALKRLAQPWEIAAAAVYLASDEAAFVTGSALVVDGGYMAGK